MKLRTELATLRPTQLRKRAAAAGVEPEEIDDAEDGDTPTETLTELILAAGTASTPAPATPQHPHFGASGGSDKPQQPHHQLKRIGKSASADLVRAVIPNGKHAMLSYQWCVP